MTPAGLIDIHCHILPGIDDGARDLEQSVAMARLWAAAGARPGLGLRGADPRGVGGRDAAFEPAPEVDATVIPLPAAAGLAEGFAGGPGALHIYEKEQPPALG